MGAAIEHISWPSHIDTLTCVSTEVWLELYGLLVIQNRRSSDDASRDYAD
jgi:hypothetical protein